MAKSVRSKSSPTPNGEPLLTTEELATWLRISRFSVYRHVRDGMPHYRIGPHHRFKCAEVEAWMRRSTDGSIDGTGPHASHHTDTFRRTANHTMSIEEATSQLKELMR